MTTRFTLHCLSPGLALFLFPFLLFAQHQSPQWTCGSDLLHRHIEQNPVWREKHQQMEQRSYDFFSAKTAPGAEKSMMAVTLPVVVHIVHDNGAENISDAQVLTGIQQLNDAFANMAYYDQGTGVHTMIQFCLAKRTPDEQATSGITRTQSALTEMTLEEDDISLKDLSRWTPTDYINIWLVREICSSSSGCGVAGYAYLPSSHGNPEDGIVMESDFLGSSPGGTGVLAHEMGHYLGLHHTFQGGCVNNDCLADGDRVCDTPPDQSTLWVACDAQVNTCDTDSDSGFATDQPDMILNFMDYTSFDCFNDFTQGQSDRMHWHIDNVRASLLESKACQDPCPNPVAALFTASALSVNVGQTVNFTNNSTNGDAYIWTINGTPFSSATNASYTFNTAGVFAIVLTASSNNTALCRSDGFQVVIEVTCPVVADFTVNTITPNPGESVTITDLTQNATQREWFLEGVSQGASFTGFTPAATGVYVIRLVASNGFCEQTKLTYISVQDSCMQTTFQKKWGDAQENQGTVTTLLADGNFLVAGFTRFNGQDDIYLLKIAPDGSTIWQKRFGDPNEPDFARRLTPLPDGGWILCATTTQNSVSQPLLARFSADGTVLWQRKITTTGPSNGFTHAILLQDGNLLVSGSIYASNAIGFAGILIKMTLSGTIIWSNLYDGGHTDWFNSIREAPDGSLVVAGFTLSFGQNTSSIHDGMVLRLTANGTLLWVNAYGTIENEGFSNIFFTDDGGLMVSGGTSGFNGNTGGQFMDQSWLTKLSAGGALQWSRVFQNNQNVDTSAREVCQTEDGGYVFAGNDTSPVGVDFPLFFKVGPTGDVEWSRLYTTPGQNRVFGMDDIPEGYIFTGYSFTNGIKDVLFIKADEAGIAGVCNELPHNLTALPVQPVVETGIMSTLSAPALSTSNLVISDIALPETTPCAPQCVTPAPEICNNNLDDDGDGLFDCLDDDCDCSSCDGEQSRIWYFGNKAGLDFSTNPPAVLTDGQTQSREAAAVATDQMGNLLFYTDGGRLFNRNHTVMPNGNGLAGHYSSTQALILPQPDHPWRFFVFHPNSYENLSTGQGLSYSVVNMSLEGSLGDVEASQKNIELIPQNLFTEKITATRDCNRKDWWVLVKERNNNVFRAYPLTENGLGVPVISTVGTSGSSSAPNILGCLKFSPDGRKVVNALYNTNGFEVFDFDHTTGLLSNPVTVTTSDMASAYGVEFSPDSKLLYLTNVAAPSHLWQFDLTAADAAAMFQSAVVLAAYPASFRFGQLQRAPNGKIYVANPSSATQFSALLGIIHRPEMPGTACLYQHEGLNIAPGGANNGLPSFPQEFLPKTLYQEIEGMDSICQIPASLTFNLTTEHCALDSVHWTLMGTGDITAQNDESISITFNEAGTATLVSTGFSECAIGSDTLVIRLFDNPMPTLDLGPDIQTCDNGVAVLHAGPGFHEYRWNDGLTDSTYTTLFPGTYWVDVWDICGNHQSDTVHVTVLPPTVLNLGEDQSICSGTTLPYHLPAAFTRWEWSPQDGLDCHDCNTVQVAINASVTYVVIAYTPENCVSADTLSFTFSQDTIFTAIDTAICANETLLFLGQELPADTTLVFYYTSIGGCDSVLTLTVMPLDTAHTFVQALLCAGDTLMTNGAVVTTDSVLVFQLTGTNGCDSLVTVTVELVELLTRTVNLTACPDSFATYNGIEILAGNSLTIAVPGEAGACDSLITITVMPLQAPVVLLPQTDTLHAGNAIRLNANVSGTAPFLWQWAPVDPTGWLSCYNCPNPEASPLTSILYSVIVTDGNGCQGTDSVALVVAPCKGPYVPNAFSPNDDGANDRFYLHTEDCPMHIRYLRIFDRWGELVFERRDFLPNDAALGWDGEFRGRKMDSGVFVWAVELEFPDGAVILKKGDVALLR